MNKKNFRLSALASAVTVGILSAAPTLAALPTIVPDCARVKSGAAPGIDCVFTMMGNILELILGTMGALALVYFVLGGFKIILAQGESGKINEGKTIIKNAVLGIIIILAAGYLVDYGLARLGVKDVASGSCLDKNDKAGINIVIDGETRCVQTCGSLKNEGYECQDTTTRTGGTSGCYQNLCKGTPAATQCCPITTK